MGVGGIGVGRVVSVGFRVGVAVSGIGVLVDGTLTIVAVMPARVGEGAGNLIPVSQADNETCAKTARIKSHFCIEIIPLVSINLRPINHALL
jgi:hypothetical protein